MKPAMESEIGLYFVSNHTKRDSEPSVLELRTARM